MYGEAIRKVRPWTATNEGDVWFTQKKGKMDSTVYALMDFDYDEPETSWQNFSGRRLTLRSIQTTDKTKVSILGQEGECQWHQDKEGLHITAFNQHTVQIIAYPGSSPEFREKAWNWGPDWPVAVKITHVTPLELKKTASDEGQRNASLIKLRPEYEERYIILHNHPFPGVLDRLRKCNIRNYSIFLKDGLLFSFFEYTGQDFPSDMKAMADPVTKDWWKLTDPMQEPLESRKEGEWWASAEELFHWGNRMIPYSKALRYAFRASLPLKTPDEYKGKLKNIENNLLQKLEGTNIQYISLFSLDGSVFAYIEYAGKDFTYDAQPFLTQLGLEFKKLDWKSMKEVFHTD
jgi:L-rhamnose mutarotase